MKPIAFIDIEVQPKTDAILDIGAVTKTGSIFHAKSTAELSTFLQTVDYLCGHNIIKHDLKYLRPLMGETVIDTKQLIDTLYLSALLFPRKPYHALVKDEKLLTYELNNPVNDALKAKELFFDEVKAFHELTDSLQQIFFLLLREQQEFKGFFHYIDYQTPLVDPVPLIKEHFAGQICEHADLDKLIKQYPTALAYCLALINVNDRFSITPPWILSSYPEVDQIMNILRNRPCLHGCAYCAHVQDPRRALKYYFGFDSYRTYGGEPLQEQAVRAAINNKSLLAVFPTGGGKSITFQVPALMSGETVKGLTVVISPLLSLMKDQVDNLEKKGITEAVTINGLLNPIERAQALERVQDGSASLLYISPEALRSRTIEHLLLGRKIVRFVIDEAHCFSAWGHDFRVDYLYIGDFIKRLQDMKKLAEGIPVSCFTATAKQKVIEDIQSYFKEKLNLDLELFQANTARPNLHYKVIEKTTQEDKYNTLRNLLDSKECPTIIYVSRTRLADELAERLTNDGFPAKPYHGQMEREKKAANQDAFITGEVSIIVATSAFGMGVDKKDVGMVIHFEISDSLENYIQEAGRAGRDEQIDADCYILYCDDDLDKHFVLLNQSRINIKEIQQIWKAIKEITRFRETVSQSALEIARKAGWDENISNIETRVKTAITALEEAGYIQRGQNMPRVYADSINCRNAEEAIQKIENSPLFDETNKENAVRIIKKLIAARSRSRAQNMEAESRVDWIADQLALTKAVVIETINLLRQADILADDKDLQAYIKETDKVNRSLQIFHDYCSIEQYLLDIVAEEEATYNIKEINEAIEKNYCPTVTPHKIYKLLNYWAVKKLIKYKKSIYSQHQIRLLCLEEKERLRERLKKRRELAGFIIEYLYARRAEGEDTAEKLLVRFSLNELRKAYTESQRLFKSEVTLKDIEDTLHYLSRIEAITIEGGFLIIYNPLVITRLEKDNRKRFKLEDYRKLEQFYEQKVQQIHIVGEYARKLLANYREALQFVEDYFRLNYSSFLRKYFKANRAEEIRLNISPGKFRQLFGELSPTQLSIIRDNQSQHIAVLAGPGSGKTRVLVHKMASLVLMEDVKYEQLLMLTFSRAAATEFKKRLVQLIGGAANFIEIKTFHAYCFDLLGRVGSSEQFDQVIKNAIAKIEAGEVEPGRITKTVLVIDEAQDMDKEVFALLQTLMKYNEDMRVIAVGDDDQNIFGFRGSSAKYLERFIVEKQAAQYELLENYRSKSNLVYFANQFAATMRKRLKKTDIMPQRQDDGKIKLVHYMQPNLLTPFVADLCRTELTGSTCVLTQTNDEALQVTGMLLDNGVPARLIQTNDGFNLFDLVEVRYFWEKISADLLSPLLDEDSWKTAKQALRKRYGRSEVLDLCQRMIKDFETIYPHRKYKSDFAVFIKESRLEDFYPEARDTIFVSTIHKAKGKEFDNIFLLLENFIPDTEEKKRQLYVALTRAKNNLAVHLNDRYLNHIRVNSLLRVIDRNNYSVPERLVVQLTHRDVWLDYFIGRQHVINDLQSGDLLYYQDGEWLTEKGLRVLRAAKSFTAKINRMRENGYLPTYGKVNFIIYWRKETEEKEIKIVLPELYFARQEQAHERMNSYPH
ncbi:MAG: RecQ family ATP-dependent DNA helicase [Dethiobacteraceae bacterium]|jgi:ATP-dependent DNA helicase RecQ|nr:RecQ family ATP-dependent DNA helicase [Bacillota bacterium]